MWLIAVVIARPAHAEDPDSSSPVFEFMRESLSDYSVFQGAAADTKLTFQREPIYQWTVLISGRNDGALFLWLNKGRPEVAGCVVTRPSKRILYHEFHSLSQQSITARLKNKKSWYPDEPGLLMKPVPGATPPASNSAQRRIQMRTLAREFNVSVIHQKDGTRWETRMLARPVYQYSMNDGDVLDGGLFLFVRANDPQLIIVLEARRHESTVQWEYGLARLSSNEIVVKYGRKTVQTIEKWPWRFKPNNVRPCDEPYAQFEIGVYPADAE